MFQGCGADGTKSRSGIRRSFWKDVQAPEVKFLEVPEVKVRKAEGILRAFSVTFASRMIRYGTLTEIWHCLAPCYHNMFFWFLERKLREGSRRFQTKGLQVLKGFVTEHWKCSHRSDNLRITLKRLIALGRRHRHPLKWESATLRVV